MSAAYDWHVVPGSYLSLSRENRVPAQFGEVIDRMRSAEWADDFWVSCLAPAAFGIPVSIFSSVGPAYDRMPQSLAPWIPGHTQCSKCGKKGVGYIIWCLPQSFGAVTVQYIHCDILVLFFDCFVCSLVYFSVL